MDVIYYIFENITKNLQKFAFIVFIRLRLKSEVNRHPLESFINRHMI